MEEQKTVPCWACGGNISPEDSYCKFCGKGQGKFVPWYYKPLGIIVMTFFALGPFSIFLVWKSPVLSTRDKWFYTVAIILASLFLLYKLYQIWLSVGEFLSPLSGSGPGLM